MNSFDVSIQTQQMSSREISELFGKQHSHVLRKIRDLEAPYVTVFGDQSKFGLVKYLDSKGESRPEYLLDKSQALYVASRFSPELHALVQKRWEELESSALNGSSASPRPVPSSALTLPIEIAEHTCKASLSVLDMLGVPKSFAVVETAKLVKLQTGIDLSESVCHSTYLDNVPARDLMLEPLEFAKILNIPGGQPGATFNNLLALHGLQVKTNGLWRPTPKGEPFCQRHQWTKNGKSGYNLKWLVKPVTALVS